MQLCELSLQATGLTQKKGAEILPRQFEEVCTLIITIFVKIIFLKKIEDFLDVVKIQPIKLKIL